MNETSPLLYFTLFRGGDGESGKSNSKLGETVKVSEYKYKKQAVLNSKLKMWGNRRTFVI